MKNSLLALMFLCAAGVAGAQSQEDKAREILNARQAAVVTVQLVVKEKMSGLGMGDQDNESKMEITGTIINPEGLTVVALSETDRSSMFSNFMSDEMSDHFKMESSISDVKILLQDGKELASGVVLRDKDLDLAFVRPKEKPAEALPYVDLTKMDTVRVMDKVVAINRLGKVANRTASASFEYIEAVATKPRLFYFPSRALTMTGSGCPAFTLDDNIVGIFVIRTIVDKSGGGPEPGRTTASVILPAQDINEAASQAPPFGQEPKEEAPKVEAPKDPAPEAPNDGGPAA